MADIAFDVDFESEDDAVAASCRPARSPRRSAVYRTTIDPTRREPRS
jgi:hypothetical protein